MARRPGEGSRVRVHRSPLRQFLMGIAGLLLIVAAIDVIWAHQVTLDPERDDNGVLTRRGESRLRQDVVVGTVFLLTGGGLMAVAISGLLNPRPVCEISDGGITLRIAGPRTSIHLPWSDIEEVRSGGEPDDGERIRPVLLLALAEPYLWPEEYWGARRDGRWLIVDAATWNVDIEEVVVHADLARVDYERESLAAADAGLPDDELPDGEAAAQEPPEEVTA